MTLRLLGVAPRDREHLLALGDEVLDHAAPGRDVEDVVLVDRRRDEQQRHLAHLRPSTACSGSARTPRCAARPIPGEAARLPPTSNLLVSTVAGSRGGVDRSCSEPTSAAHQVGAAGVHGLLDHGRVRPREVGRRERVEHVAGREPAPVARRASRRRRPRSARRRSRRPRGSPAARRCSSQLPSQAGSENRRSPLAGASSERPVAARASSAVSPAARAATRPGWRASPAPTLTAGRGARNLGGPPSDASVSITSSPDRAAPVVRRTRDGAPLDVAFSLIVLLRVVLMA